MSDSDKKVSYGVTADASPFEQGMQRAADATRNAATNIESNFKKVQDAFSQVQKQLLVLAGIVAGGAFFKDAINASNQLTGETMKLSKALGINAEEAATLRTALEDIGSSGDEYVDTFTKFARQLKSNEDGLRDMGLQTRDANGNLRDSNDLFTEALQTVSSYKAGLDQNTAAQTLFGRSVDDVMKLQKLNNGVLEEAKRKNQELGLVITKENVEASKAYKLAMNDVGNVLTAVKKVIGDAVMPVFTELGEYLASTGPYVVEVFKGAMLGLLVVFETIKAAVKSVAVVIFETINQAGDIIGLLGEMFVKLVKADYQGVYEAGQKIGARLKQGFVNAASGIADAAKDAAAAIGKDYGRIYGDKVAAPAPTGGRKRMGDFKSGKDKSDMSGWEAELAEQKLAFQEQNNQAGTFYQFSKQQELQFWKDKLTLTVAGSADNISVRRKAADLQLSINTDAFQRELANLQAQEAAYKQNLGARLALLDREAALVKQRFGQESKEYEEVQKKIVEAKRQAAEQLKQIDMLRAESTRNAHLAEVQIAEQQAQLEYDMGSMSAARLIALQAQFEDQRFQIQMQGLKDREQIAAADPDRNPVELARIHGEIEELERQHQLRLGQIRNQQTLESTAASRKMADAITGDMQSSLSRMLQGMTSFSGFLKAMWQSVRSAVADTLAKMVVDFIKNSAIMAAVKRALAIFDIGANAAQAGAGAASSAADVPVVGWLMAPIAAAATFAMASAFSSNIPSFSAAGGFDIPSTLSPLVQAHPSEMVLPAKHADVIRRLGDEGGAAAGGDVHVHFNGGIANDERSIRKFFKDNNTPLMAAIRSAQRDNK